LRVVVDDDDVDLPPFPPLSPVSALFFAQAAATAAMLHKCNKRDLRLVFCVWPSGQQREAGE